MAHEERDKLATLERRTDQAALDAYARLTGRRTPFRPELRTGNTEREDYVCITGPGNPDFELAMYDCKT